MTRLRRPVWTAWAAAAVLLAAMVWLSPDFGFTWDERFQQKYGEEIWDYYHGRLPRASFDTDLGNQYLYGGLVEILCAVAQHAFPRADLYVVRHMVIAIFGWAGIVFCGRLAARAFGTRAGWIAAALLAVSPRYIGDAMNNPKDAPFAALTMAALFYTLTIDWRPPHLSWPRTACLAAAIALAINVRPLGLLLLGFAAGIVMLTALASALLSSDAGRWRGVGAAALRLAVVGLVAIPLGTIAWPWAQAQPYVRPIRAFFISTQVNWASGFDVLYGGQVHGAGSLPWHYVPYWLVMALPMVLLGGLALSLLVWRLGMRASLVWSGLALFAAAPIAGAIWRHATIYDGIRHILFIVPPLTVMAAAGWQMALSLRPPLRMIAALLLAIGLAEPALFQLRNHPNQIVYFSPVVGGPRAAFGNYDMDYWANSVLQATEWSARLADELGVPLGISGNPIQAVQADAARHHALFVTDRSALTFHLDVRLLRGPPEAVREFASRPDVLFAAKTADGTPLTVVLPGPAYPSLGPLLEAHHLHLGSR